MLRPLAASAALAAVLGLSSDCTTKPPVLRCPTTTDSVTFMVEGSCATAGGVVRISTNPGYCAITLETICPTTDPGCTPILPTSGTFTGDASQTNYDISQGNWMLEAMSPDPQADPSSSQCDATPAATTGMVTVACTINSCTPSGEDTGFTCSPNSCDLHLTPLPDGGVDSGEPDAAEPDAGEPDAGADTGEVDSGGVDSGEKDSGEKDGAREE